MKLAVTWIPWDDSSEHVITVPGLYGLSDDLMGLYLMFANGVIREMKAEGDSEDAIQVLRGLALGAGNCTRADNLTDEIRERSRLYEGGWECYVQGDDAYIFIDPAPQPDLGQKESPVEG